jgi:hypothetical protein
MDKNGKLSTLLLSCRGEDYSYFSDKKVYWKRWTITVIACSRQLNKGVLT